MRIATWNVNCFNADRRQDKRVLLELEKWDVALLQEVRPDQFDVLVEGPGYTGVSAVALAGGPWSDRAHGAAIVLRPPWRVESAGLLPVDETSVENPEWLRARGVWATIANPETAITAASIHLSNAAGGGVARKMAHFRSLAAWIEAAPRPLIVGGDFNTWSDRLDAAPVDDSDPFADEQAFVNSDADHGLQDVLVEHLRTNRPDLLERRKRLNAVGADGALDVTYQRAPSNYPKVNRMDRIYASTNFRVRNVTSLYADALTVGSDHALVIADLA